MTNEQQPVVVTLDVDGKKHKITGRDVRLRLEPVGATTVSVVVSEQITMRGDVLQAAITTHGGDGLRTTTVVRSTDTASSHETAATGPAPTRNRAAAAD